MASNQSRRPPTVKCAMSWNAARSWASIIKRVTSSVSYGSRRSSRKVSRDTSASTHCAAARSTSEAAAQPDNSSPLRRAACCRPLYFLKLVPTGTKLISARIDRCEHTSALFDDLSDVQQSAVVETPSYQLDTHR